MNLRKLLAILLALLLLTGCSAESGTIAHNSGAAADGLYGNASSGNSNSENSSSVTADRKLIRRISMEAETEDMDQLLSAIDAKLSELSGYTESRTIRNGNSYDGYDPVRHASLVIRIPADRLDSFADHLSGISNVISSSEKTQDVTLDYIATDSRIKALEAEEERLLALIDQAQDLSELLQLDERLTDIRTELEQVKSQLRLYDDLIDYGTVSLEIQEVRTLTPKEEPGFWSRIATGFRENLQWLTDFLTETAIFLISSTPILLPLTLLIVAVILIIKRRRKKSPPTSTPEPPAAPTEL